MEHFLTPKLQETFADISLDYTYKYALHFFDRVKRHISSTSDRGHYEILLNMMNHDLVQYDSIAYNHLVDFDMFKGANRLAGLGDMIFHNIKYKRTHFSSILYCPENLSEYQILRLRLWYEYFNSIEAGFNISTKKENTKIELEPEETHSFLEEKGILDDAYIKKLTKKFPDYQE